jgi:serine/threonine-protein kinase
MGTHLYESADVARFAGVRAEGSRDGLGLQPLVPPALAAVVERALAKDPANRYSDAGAMRRALETLSIAVPTQQVDTAIIEPPESSNGADSVYRQRLLLGWLVWSAALAAAVVWLIAM